MPLSKPWQCEVRRLEFLQYTAVAFMATTYVLQLCHSPCHEKVLGSEVDALSTSNPALSGSDFLATAAMLLVATPKREPHHFVAVALFECYLPAAA